MILLSGLIQSQEVMQQTPSRGVFTDVSRDTEGYPCISSVKEACEVYPKTIKEVQDRCMLAQEEIKKLVSEIISCPVEKQNKETVVRALDRIYAWMDSARHPLYAMSNCHPNEALRSECLLQGGELLTFFIEQIESNQALYRVVKQYRDTNAKNEFLLPAERYFLERMMSNFERAGCALSQGKVAQLLKLKKRCVELEAQFQENINNDTSRMIVSKEQLAGMSEEWIASLPRQGEQYVLVAIQHYYPILTHCSVEATRESFYRLYNNRAYPANAFIVRELVRGCHKRAKLLGYASFAEYELATQMIRTPEKALTFLNDVLMRIQGGEEKNPKRKPLWNAWYQDPSSEQGKKAQKVKVEEYFIFDQTLSSLIKIYEQFFDIIIEKIPADALWHPDVQLLRVSTKDKKVLQYLFLDLFARDKKMPCASLLGGVDGIKKSESKLYPAVATILCSFNKQEKENQLFLSYDDVSVLFHEFGHAMHSAFARTSLCYQAGIKNVTYDFIEVPSKLMEYWLGEREIVQLMSCHYKTGKALSDEVATDLAKNAPCKSSAWPRHTSCWGGCLLEVHGSGKKKDIEQIHKKWRDRVYLYHDRGNEYHDYCSVTQVVGETYGPKMYSYTWCHALAADLYSHIEKEGILNPKAGKRYVDTILSQGASKDPHEMLRDYLGREPHFDAFYKKMGLEK
jgi:Zn-dependent oligopeptidase